MSVHLHSTRRSISEDSNIHRHKFEKLESRSAAVQLRQISMQQLDAIYCKSARFLPPTRTVNISTLAIFLDPHHQLEQQGMERVGKKKQKTVKMEEETMGMGTMRKYCI
jgi:hypothetical protein